MNTIVVALGSGILSAYGKEINVWCNVRNELNGERKIGSKAVYTQNIHGTRGVPYMPRIFPFGTWEVSRIISHPDKKMDGYLYPYFIDTTAHQRVERWEIDPQGCYVRPTREMVDDYGYGLHFSSSRTTLGCIRIEKEADLRWLVSQIDEDFSKKNAVTIFVNE